MLLQEEVAMKTLEAGLMKNWTSKHRESSANNSIEAKGTQCVGMSDGGDTLGGELGLGLSKPDTNLA